MWGFLTIVGGGCACEKGIFFSAASGAVLGLAGLCRPFEVYWAVVLVPLHAIVFLRNAAPPVKRGSVLASTAALLAGVGLAVAPWIWRNYRLTGVAHLSPLRGINLFQTAAQVLAKSEGCSLEEAKARIRAGKEDVLLPEDIIISNPDNSRAYAEVSWPVIRSHPEQLPRLAVFHLLRTLVGPTQSPFRVLLWGDTSGLGTARTLSVKGALRALFKNAQLPKLGWLALEVAYLLAIYVAALLGIRKLGLRRETMLLTLAALFFVVVSLPLQTNYRFRVPALLPVYILAAASIGKRRKED